MPIPPKYPLLTEMRLENLVAADVRRILNQTAAQISQDFAKLGNAANPLTRMQLEAQQAAITGYLRQDFQDIEKTIAAGQKLAAKQASEVVSRYENQLLEMVMDPAAMKALARSEALRAQAGVDSALRRMSGQSYKPLSKTVYDTAKLSQGWVDETINKALAAGWSRARLAKELTASISPAVPGGVSYAANRTARTEINNAFHASANQRYADSPIVEGVDWHLSSSHPEGDICDTLAAESPYPKKSVPQKPHPHCYCFTTPALPSEEEFIENLFAGKYGEEPFVAKADPVKKSQALFSKADISKMDRETLTPILQQQQDDVRAYASKYMNAGGKELTKDAGYLELRNTLDALYTRQTQLRNAEAAILRQAKVGVHPKIDKLPKMAIPSSLDTAYAAGKANPNGRGWFNQKTGKVNTSVTAERDYQINCTRVAWTTEMRMRGYDVTAAPAGDRANKSDAWIKANWVDPKTAKARPMRKALTEEKLMADMAKQPEGSRFFVVAGWKDGGAHIWNAEKRNGKIIFHEGQVYRDNSGTEAFTRQRLTQMDFEAGKRYSGNAVRWMRVDDLEPTDVAITRGWAEVNGKVTKNPK